MADLVGNNGARISKKKGGWTEEREQQALSMFLTGKSFTEIGIELGKSRSSVAGKIDRLGGLALMSQSEKSHRMRCSYARMQNRPEPPFRFRGAPDPHRGPKMNPKDIKPRYQSSAEAVEAVINAKRDTCRYPEGDPTDSEFKFCGDATDPGDTYCSHHKSVVYRPREH